MQTYGVLKQNPVLVLRFNLLLKKRPCLVERSWRRPNMWSWDPQMAMQPWLSCLFFKSARHKTTKYLHQEELIYIRWDECLNLVLEESFTLSINFILLQCHFFLNLYLLPHPNPKKNLWRREIFQVGRSLSGTSACSLCLETKIARSMDTIWRIGKLRK